MDAISDFVNEITAYKITIPIRLETNTTIYPSPIPKIDIANAKLNKERGFSSIGCNIPKTITIMNP